MDVSSNNKRIAKNTIALYIRMLVMTLISLYTVRVTFKVLGIDDYGIYNVVCGLIGFLGFITTTLSTSAQRFLAFDLGQGNKNDYTHTFSMIFYIILASTIIIVLLAELFGPWLINNYLVIPVERLNAAKIIYQISIVSFIVRFLVVPYSSSIIAYEKMGIFAYISIFESLAKLGIVYLLTISPIDKLVSYAILLLFTDIIVTIIYVVVCVKNLPGCKIICYWNRTKLGEMGRFMGWSIFGSLSAIFSTQGLSIIMNMFFSPAVIASKAVADKVNSFSYSFVANFITATSPQMTKYYSIGDIPNLVSLFFRTSKICFFLMLVISIPLIISASDLLSVWLSEELLDDMILFTRLTLISTLFSAFETPISRAVHAAGNVKLYQIVNCIVSFIALPIVFILFKAGYPPFWSYIVSIVLLALSIIYRLIILHKYVEFSYKSYVNSVILPVLVVVAISIPLSYLITRISFENIFIRLLIQLSSAVVVLLFIIFVFGLKKAERSYIIGIIKSKI